MTSMTTSTPSPKAKPSGIPSLLSPPQAPKIKAKPLWRPWLLEDLRLPLPFEDEEERGKRKLRQAKEEERAEYERWPIRRKYLKWTPLEVDEIEDANLLQFLFSKYAFPSSQPRNGKETAFFDIMKERILFRMLSLNISPPVHIHI